MAFTRSSGEWRAVSITIGMWLIVKSWRTLSISSMPSMRGIIRSVTMMSGISLRIFSRASAPSSASTT